MCILNRLCARNQKYGNAVRSLRHAALRQNGKDGFDVEYFSRKRCGGMSAGER
jgi:hypothetical protein